MFTGQLNPSPSQVIAWNGVDGFQWKHQCYMCRRNRILSLFASHLTKRIKNSSRISCLEKNVNNLMRFPTKIMTRYQMIWNVQRANPIQIILHTSWLYLYITPSVIPYFSMASRGGRDVGTSSILANLLDCYLQLGPSTQEQPGNLHHGSIGVKSSICWLVDFCSFNHPLVLNWKSKKLIVAWPFLPTRGI